MPKTPRFRSGFVTLPEEPHMSNTPKPQVRIQHVGGSFAPPLTDEILTNYRKLAIKIKDEGRLYDEFSKLLTLVEAWWKLPESEGTESRPHTSGRGTVVDLSEDNKSALYDLIPWTDELKLLSNEKDTGVFDSLPPGELRNAAFHLLWFAHELNLDREPITVDKL